jgi:hypothetical protein
LVASREKTPPFLDQSAGSPFYQCALPLAQAKENACQEADDNSDHHGEATI